MKPGEIRNCTVTSIKVCTKTTREGETFTTTTATLSGGETVRVASSRNGWQPSLPVGYKWDTHFDAVNIKSGDSVQIVFYRPAHIPEGEWRLLSVTPK